MFRLEKVDISIKKKPSVVVQMENPTQKKEISQRIAQRKEAEKKKKSSQKEEISVKVVYGEKSLKECMKSVLELQI